MTQVLDSSVIAKWYFPEEYQQKSLKLKRLHIENQITITAPKLLLFELGNVFVKRGLNQRDFNDNFQKLLNFEIDFVETDLVLLESTFAVARQYRITFYDAVYVALAQKLKCDLVTDDRRLYQATKKLKFVKLLKDISN